MAFQLLRAPALAALAAAAACSGASPSSGPLSPEVERPAPRKSSSRWVDEEQERKRAEEQQPPPQAEQDDFDPDEDPGEERVGSSRTCAAPAPARIDCGRIAGSARPDCLGATLARRACETWGPSLDGAVAEAWLECLAASAARAESACESQPIVRCGLDAIRKACIDGSYRGACAEIAEECGDLAPELTPAVCERAVAAFVPAERAKIVECLRHGCRTGGFGSCIP